MNNITQLTGAFRCDNPLKMLKILSKMVSKTEQSLELEYFTGTNKTEWLVKLKKSITTGEFMLLLRFFKIGVSIDPDGILYERCLLEKTYLEPKQLLNIDIEFDTLHWLDLHPSCFIVRGSLGVEDEIMEMFEPLKEVIKGQDDQLKRILFFIHTNLNIIQHNKSAAIQMPKRKMLITGGTGTGKTFTVQKVAEYLEIPLVEFDVSQLTQSGYVGMDIADIVEALSANSPQYPQILFLDEFDKLCVLNNDKGNVGTYGGQRSLLKILESQIMRVDGYSKDKRHFDDYDMTNVIIILGGAFSAFQDKQELELKSNIGFGVGDKIVKSEVAVVTEKQLIDSGIIPEIAGRLGQVVVMNQLDHDALKEILTTSKESILKQFKLLSYYDNKEFNLTDEEIDDIIKESKKLKLGVRGLSTLTEKKYIEHRLK